MELLDFVRLRWKVLALLLVLGFVGIIVAGQSSGGGAYTARAQLLVRPPSDQISVYGGDPSRYVTTEMRLLYRDEVIKPAAAEGGVTQALLARSLTFQTSGGEVVTLVVSNPSAARAVELVNDVTEAYLADSKERALTPSEERNKAVSTKISNLRKSLTDIQQREQGYIDDFVAANPDRAAAAQTAVPARLSSQATFLTSQLNGLYNQQVQSSLESPETRSEVLRPASGASQPAGWGPTTYLAGFVGWALVLLALAGLAVVLSRRVLGPTRWNSAADGLALGRAIDLHRPPFSQRKQGLNRIANVLRKEAGPAGKVVVAHFPESTPALTKGLSLIEDRLAQSDLGLTPAQSLPEAVEALGKPGSAGSPVLMLVDVALCSLDDVESFGDYPVEVQRRIVPVLV